MKYLTENFVPQIKLTYTVSNLYFEPLFSVLKLSLKVLKTESPLEDNSSYFILFYFILFILFYTRLYVHGSLVAVLKRPYAVLRIEPRLAMQVT